MLKNNSLVFFFVCVLISSIAYSPFIIDAGLTPRLIFIALLTFTFSFLFIKTKNDFVNNPVLAIYSSYTFWIICSNLWATNTSEALFESSKQVVFLLLTLISFQLIKTEFNRFIILLGKVSSIISILLFLIAFGQIMQLANISKEEVYTISSLLGHKNLLSSYVFMSSIMILLSLPRQIKPWTILSYIALAFNISLIIFLRTKAVWIAVTVSALVYLFLKSSTSFHLNKKKALLLSGIIFLLFNLAVYVFIPIITAQDNTVSNQNQPKLAQRIDPERSAVWNKTIYTIKKHPVIGVGAGNWQIHFPDAGLDGIWRAEDLNVTFQRPHNDFLWIASETGFIGISLFLSTIALVIGFLMKDYTENRSHLTLMLLTFFIGYLIISFFDFPKERIEHQIIFHITLALSVFLLRDSLRVSFNLNKFQNEFNPKLIFALLSLIALLVGVLRYRGEYLTKKMYLAKSSNQYMEVVKIGNLALNMAYSIDPTSVPINWYIGNAYALMSNYVTARQCFEKAYKIAPYNRHVLNDLASAYHLTNEKEKAITFYEESIRISPRFDDPKLNLAAIYINDKKFDLATQTLSKLLHDSPRRTQYLKLIEVGKEMQKFEVKSSGQR